MRPYVEQAIAEALPHSAHCPGRRLDAVCECGANKRRNTLIAKLSTREGYVYLDRHR